MRQILPRNKYFLILNALVAAGLLTTTPAALAKDVRLTGLGTRKCTEWQEWKTAQNGEARAMTIEWANGFISGHNIYARIGKEPANSVIADAKTLATLLDNYCQKNPESRIFNGVIDITQSLGGAKLNIAPKAPTPGNVKPDDPKVPKDT